MAEHRGPFTVNREEVVSKVIDGELIIIRLSDGTYYSMENVGTRVWELVERHHDLPAVVRRLPPGTGRPRRGSRATSRPSCATWSRNG